jgi:organic radical activating enzyme
VQIETNGDLLRYDSLQRAIIVTSPKAVLDSNMVTGSYKRMPPGALHRTDYLKLLIEDIEESAYYDIPDYVYDFADAKESYRVMLSPIAAYRRLPKVKEGFWGDCLDRAQTQHNYNRAVKIALDRGFRVSFQTHLLAQVE